jgi:hypothetical protein
LSSQALEFREFFFSERDGCPNHCAGSPIIVDMMLSYCIIPLGSDQPFRVPDFTALYCHHAFQLIAQSLHVQLLKAARAERLELRLEPLYEINGLLFLVLEQRSSSSRSVV